MTNDNFGVEMEKVIGLIVLGLIFGISVCFSAGSMEAARLAEGVNFENQSEVITYATVLRNNEAVISQAKEEGVSVDIWIRNTLEQMTQQYHEAKKEEANKQAELMKLSSADNWASRNLGTGVILLDTNTRKHLKEEYDKNKARYAVQVDSYRGKILRCVGKVSGINSYSDSFWIYLSSIDGIALSVSLPLSEREHVLKLNEGDIVVLDGRYEDNRTMMGNIEYRDSIRIESGSIRQIFK